MTCVACLSSTLQRERKGKEAWSRDGSPHCSQRPHPYSIIVKGFPSVSPPNPELELVPREQATWVLGAPSAYPLKAGWCLPQLLGQRACTCGLRTTSFREHIAHAHNPSLLQRRKSRYAELDFEVSAGASLTREAGNGNWRGAQGRGQQQVGRRGGCGCPSGLRTPGPNPQKIMHTRKRHQDMFQDLNRKLQHAAEKEKEVPGVDSKVRSTGSAPATIPGLAVPSQMCTGQGRRILSLALSGRFQTVLPHSPDLIMGTAATAGIRAVGCVGCCSLWETLPKSPSLFFLLCPDYTAGLE